MEGNARRLLSCGLFAAAFGVYLFSSAPALAPYRDMGEMVSVAKTLGVAHPPGYPGYALIGKISTFLPFANPSYRVNLASVLGGALAALFLFWTLIELGSHAGAALAGALFWTGASGPWTVSVVTEMYSLNLAAAFLVLFIAARISRTAQTHFEAPFFYLLFFLLGFSCGLRLDLVLLGAGAGAFALFLLWRTRRLSNGIPFVLTAGAFFAAGFSIYLYLLIRSGQSPYLNWRSPDTIEKLFETLSRKSHGGTLDLLSVNYRPGELFATDFLLYLKDFGEQFWWIGFIFAAAGIWHLYQTNRAMLVLTFTAWFFAGPFFIYKANMPPNPHAYAILEPHFLLPNAMAAVWIGMGLKSLLFPKVQVLAAAVLIAGIASRWDPISKRGNFIGYDYSRNVFATLPPDSILVMQKDVQLFLFWARQYTQDARPDVTVIARGLSGSDWYQAMRRQSGVTVYIGPLKTEGDWAELIGKNPGKGVYAGWDQDVPNSSLYKQQPAGLTRKVTASNEEKAGVSKAGEAVDLFRHIYVYRGRYRCDERNEFFSSDLIDDYSKGRFARGAAVQNSADASALADWQACMVLNPDNPQPYYRRGFAHFGRADHAAAVRDFARSERLHERLFQKTQEYHSLPEVSNAVKAEWAEANLNLGVACEKTGDLAMSEAAYLKTLRINPKFARAHYNIAVLYWNRDWAKVVEHLRLALSIDPESPEARAFYPKALAALERSKS